MRFAMIFEGIDRASKVMKKIMSAEKAAASSAASGSQKAAAATEKATRATERQASVLGRIGTIGRSAYNGVVAGANAAAKATVALHHKTIALAKAGLGQVVGGGKKTLAGLTVAAGLAASAFGTAALAAGSFTGVASEFEKFQTILETTEGSSIKAKNAMGWIKKFAIDTPLELDQVVESYRNLKTFGLDPTNGTLMALTDTMAASGKGTEQLEGLTLAFGQAWTKGKLQGEEALQLLERGVPVWDILSQKYKKSAADLQDMASKGKLGRDAIQYVIDELGRRNAGASAKMAQTWDGMMGKLADSWGQFKLAVMDAGLFDWMKDKLQLALDTIDRLAANGTIQQWAEYVSGRIQLVLETAWQFATRLWQIMEKLGGYLKMAADTVGGWENLAMILAGMAFAPILISTAAGLVQIAMGLTMIGTALAANPVVLVMAAIAAAAVAIWLNWGPIKGFFVDLWSSIASGAQAAWDGVKAWIGFDPVALLSKGWSAVAGVVTAAWAAIPPLTWDNVITALDWLTWVHPLRWLDLIPGFSWAGVISGALDWGAYVASLDWTKYLPAFSWSGLVTALDWATWVLPIRWLDFVPGFSWAGVISGALDWGAYIAGLDWSDYLPSFSWPTLPAFSWPDIPALALPALPDAAGWIGAFGDRALSAIEGVSARLGSAWSKVKSAFGSGPASADISVTDPATIRAAAEATAGLKADMERVAAIDTTAAMGRLGALQQAAADVLSAVTASIRQAQAVMASVSFYNQGAALMDTMAAGIRARAQVVVAEIARVAQMMRDHLPSSPAKVGPLSDIHRLKFGETIAQSIRAEPMVKAMRAAAAATMGAAAITGPAVAGPQVSADVARAQVAGAAVNSGGGQGAPGVTLQFSPVIQWDGKTPPADVKSQFEAMLPELARKLADLHEEEMRRRKRTEY